jgi:hypothetical protein
MIGTGQPPIDDETRQAACWAMYADGAHSILSLVQVILCDDLSKGEKVQFTSGAQLNRKMNSI